MSHSARITAMRSATQGLDKASSRSRSALSGTARKISQIGGFLIVTFKIIAKRGLVAAAQGLPWGARKAISSALAKEFPNVRRDEDTRQRQGDVRQIYAALVQLKLISLRDDNQRFVQLAKLIGTSISEGLFACDQLNRALSTLGDVCEFGVAQGATSALLANELKETDRKLWLYDSFEGLPPPSREDILINDIFNLGSMEKYAGTMACGENDVRSRLAEAGVPENRYQIVKGYFSNGPETKGPDTISFAYVDFDFYKPILEALEFIDARAPSGCRVIVDDYGWFSAGAQKAVDEFVSRNSDKWKMMLPPEFCGKFCMLRKGI